MDFILDIAVLLIIGVTVFSAYRRGFVRTLMSTIGVLLAFVIAVALAAPVRDKVLQSQGAVNMTQKASDYLQSILPDPSEGLKEQTAAIDENLQSVFKTLKEFGIDTDPVKAKWEEYRNSDGSDQITQIKKEAADFIAKPAISLALLLIIFVLLYLLTRGVTILLTNILDGIMKLPLLRGLNKFFGIGLGIVLALLKIWVLCTVVEIVTPVLGSFNMALAFNPENTFIFKFFDNFNLFNRFIR